jgi:hypothetical protein
VNSSNLPVALKATMVEDSNHIAIAALSQPLVAVLDSLVETASAEEGGSASTVRATMEVISPPGYLSLRDARDIFMRRMHEGIAPSEEIEKYRHDGLQVVDSTQAIAAAEALRKPLLSGELGLFAIFSSRDTPMRLHNQALIEAALFPSNSTVLTFAYVDRHSQAPFGFAWWT